MAAQKKIIDTKLQVRVENTDAAKKAIKNLNYNQIKLTATEAQLLERRSQDLRSTPSPASA